MSDSQQENGNTTAVNGNGKRKVEFAEEVEEAETHKKAKTEDVVST